MQMLTDCWPREETCWKSGILADKREYLRFHPKNIQHQGFHISPWVTFHSKDSGDKMR